MVMKQTTTGRSNMFVKANTSLGAFVTSADYTHSLCVRDRGQLHRMYVCENYDVALAAYEAVVAHNGEDKRDSFAVRSAFDVNIEVGLRSDAWVEGVAPWRVVANGIAAWQRKEEKATVKWALDNAIRREGLGIEQTFSSVIAEAMRSLNERNMSIDRWRIEATLKDMTTIGRCHGCGNGRGAYFFARSSRARLAHTRCPKCNSLLDQTTLALNAPFRLIADPIATYWNTTCDFLPGESKEQRDARIAKITEAWIADEAEREFERARYY